MKLLFAHDHRFVETRNAVLSDVHFPARDWARYLAHFDELIVAGREAALAEGASTEGFVESSASGVSFRFFENLTSPRGMTLARPKARAQMDALVAEADAVIARLPSEIGFLAAERARRLNKPYAVEVVACPWDGFLNFGTRAGMLYAPVVRYRMQRSVRQAPFAIYVTQAFLQSRYPAQGVTAAISDVSIPSPETSVLDRRLARQAEQREAGKASPLRLGLIGTLNGRFKGIQTVFEALERLGPENAEFRFHVLGPGNPAPWKELASRHGVAEIVQFDGTRAGREEVFAWLDEIDIYLQPSRKEGLPRALVEAMSRGCPAVGSTTAGIPELLDPEDMIAPGSASDLAARLLRGRDDPGWMHARAQRNWQVAARYAESTLDDARHKFWTGFREYVASGRVSRPDEKSRLNQ
ncbi:glycosyltransferase family 4 protein [Tropicimonas sp. TH_r6]|uniref:glycosyltransferase n=1 Tax=Tropicimonas sp. TH_r6 TaxID=3082085 RepID=UPI002954B5FB|nr:glycosyltransferase family 4 protein [Tropicimonas sp. TH_r6]MDV7144306.1 glycosyltransferase family 4 protein [Tropicimonas sp. TH_r6]